MTIILTSDELDRVTGYRAPKRQMQELHRQGLGHFCLTALRCLPLEFYSYGRTRLDRFCASMN